METFLLIIHIIVCFIVIFSILMQPGKSGGLSGGAFGGMGGGGGTSMFGGGGAVPVLAKVTTYAGILFALTCISLWYAGRATDEGPRTAAERLMEQGGIPAQAAPQPLTFPSQDAIPAPAATEGTTEGTTTEPATETGTTP